MRLAIVYRLIGRLYAMRVRWDESSYGVPLEAYCPGILAAFDDIAKATGKRGPYVAKCRELLKLLRRYRPRSIAEMGSGRTSLLFAAYAKNSGAKYVAFEQDYDWQTLINGLTERLCQLRPVELVEVRTLPTGGHFARPIPAHADFVYIDAPYVSGRSFPTFTGKPVYMDIPLSLDAGHRPRVIVVDGRTDTVDKIRSYEDYHFRGSWDWARERGVLAHALTPMRHSVFVARTE